MGSAGRSDALGSSRFGCRSLRCMLFYTYLDEARARWHRSETDPGALAAGAVAATHTRRGGAGDSALLFTI